MARQKKSKAKQNKKKKVSRKGPRLVQVKASREGRERWTRQEGKKGRSSFLDKNKIVHKTDFRNIGIHLDMLQPIPPGGMLLVLLAVILNLDHDP